MARMIRAMSADFPEAVKQPPPSPAFSTCSTALPDTPNGSPKEMPASPIAVPDAFPDLIADAVFEAAAATSPPPISSEAWKGEVIGDTETSHIGMLTALKWITIFVAWLFAGTAIFVASQIALFLYNVLVLPAATCFRALVPAGSQMRSQHAAK